MQTENLETHALSEMTEIIVKEGKFFAAIGYFSVLCFVPLFLKRDNTFAQFHGRQGLVLFILEIAISILKAIPFLGEIIYTIGWAILGVFSLIAIAKVLMNEYWKMPAIYSIASKITL